MKIVPKNWREFQHYSNRNPPWIRLHRKLLDNKEFHRLPTASKALAPMLWLLASESLDGVIKADSDDLAFRLRISEKDVLLALRPLIESGFFDVLQDDSSVLAACEQSVTKSCSETLQRQSITETDAFRPGDGFAEFYALYPRKVKPKDAEKAWNSIKPNAELRATIARAVEAQKQTPQWQKDGGQFIPYPATWLRAEEWKNVLVVDVSTASPPALQAVQQSNDYLADLAAHKAQATKPPAHLRSLIGGAIKRVEAA